jgi:hypothetical protein
MEATRLFLRIETAVQKLDWNEFMGTTTSLLLQADIKISLFLSLT